MQPVGTGSEHHHAFAANLNKPVSVMRWTHNSSACQMHFNKALELRSLHAGILEDCLALWLQKIILGGKHFHKVLILPPALRQSWSGAHLAIREVNLIAGVRMTKQHPSVSDTAAGLSSSIMLTGTPVSCAILQRSSPCTHL